MPLPRARPALQALQPTLLARSLSTVRYVAPAGDRHLALPLVHLSLKATPPDDQHGWQSWVDRFSSKGYSSLLVEVDMDDAKARAKSSSDLLAKLEQELVRLLQGPAHSSPFPPLLFAHSTAALLAETYVSSHPLSGLCLVDPLPALEAHTQAPSLFKAPLDDFNYEPGFPIAVVEAEKGRTEHRLLREFAEEDEEDSLVRRIVAKRDHDGWEKVQEWMDEHGL